MSNHWRKLLESDVVRFVDLERDYVVQIEKVTRGKVVGAGGKSSGKGMIHLTGWPKPIAAGTAVLSMIAGIHGTDTTKWPGKWIQIYPDSTVTYGREKVGGVRVRPTEPEEKLRVLPKTEQSGKGAA